VATLQDIKRRIRSVGNTRKITKAMELVAAARLRRAEERIVQTRILIRDCWRDTASADFLLS